jgi:hypothetical protein
MRLIFSILLVCTGLILLSLPTTAEGRRGSPEETIDSFFTLLAAGTPKEAVNTLMAPKVMELSGEKVHAAIAQLEGLSHRFGDYQGYEKLFSEEIAGRVTHHTYVAYFEGLPITFSFFLYRQATGWSITSFTFNTEYQNLGRYLN